VPRSAADGDAGEPTVDHVKLREWIARQRLVIVAGLRTSIIPRQGRGLMKIVAFEGQGGARLGIVEGDHVVDLQAADSKVPGDLGEWLARNSGDTKPLADIAKRAPASARRPLAGLKYALPVGRPGKIVCLGLNYLEHVKEGSQRDNIPKFPTIFMRGLTSLVPHGEPIIRPLVSETLDYEAELIVVIGKRAKHLTAANAISCIAGYSCGNEGSVREFQRKTTQWAMGKNFDRTGGFGPWLVTGDELPPAAKGLKIESRLNGQVMQSDNTDNMMFPVVEMLVYITQGITLEPGDVIFTGTPSGVGHARKPPVWMKNGDTCEIEIAGIGTLRNPIKDE
jgi:2-keto-4-pentenoate hydratase/2-oxohepta-3-ene-1,7-dioic acid hydratase in catechol pathway